jgi:hypothetical protein
VAARKVRDNQPTDEQNAAVVRQYLSLIEVHPIRRGRRPSAERLQARIEELRTSVPKDPVERLEQIQERIDLEAELGRLAALQDIASLEDQFVQALPAFLQVRNISYAALKEMGVPTVVLRRAGLRSAAN